MSISRHNARIRIARTAVWWVLLALFLAIPATLSAAVFNKPFTHYADRQELASVLNAFARSQGYMPSVSASLTGKVSGRFSEVHPGEFLEGMQNAFDVSWYILGNELNFYKSSERERIYLTPRTGSAQAMHAALSHSGVYSPQLPGKLSSAGNTVAVSGPPRYLAQVKAAAAAWESSQTGNMAMRVFPLKYAWAEDITVNSMDKTVTVPGIASILRAMVMGSAVGGTSVTQQKATVQKLGGTGLAAQGQEKPAEAAPETSSTSPVSVGSISIMADPRVNSVIVSDASYRMPYYEQVIRDLDKPVDLVEIHAAIVDIDTDSKRELGINFSGSYSPSKGWGGGGSMGGYTEGSSPSASALATAAGASLSTIYTHGTDFFMSRIMALEQHNEARVLGRPSVLTVDNVQATLENTTTYYVQIQGYQAVDLYKVEAGTVLRVTPHIIRERGETSIKLVVSVQDDQDSSSGTPTASGVPPIKQTKINTQALVGAGQSLLIGGYYYEQKAKEDSGVPLLKDIPLIGRLFKSTSKQSKRMERLILLTPRIVSPRDRNVPSHTDDASLHRSPMQQDYEPRIPVMPEPRRSAGCAKQSLPRRMEEPGQL